MSDVSSTLFGMRRVLKQKAGKDSSGAITAKENVEDEQKL